MERVYLGGQSMEDAFQKINEETVRENIEKMTKKETLVKYAREIGKIAFAFYVDM